MESGTSSEPEKPLASDCRRGRGVSRLRFSKFFPFLLEAASSEQSPILLVYVALIGADVTGTLLVEAGYANLPESSLV